MITDEKFEEARPFLHLDDAYILLHETSPENADSILETGLRLKKEYNGKIKKILTVPKNENEIKNYYYHIMDKSSIIVLGIPNVVFGDIQQNTTYSTLFLNCLAEFEEKQNISDNSFNNLRYQKLASTISNKWIIGYFDVDSNFIINNNYIMNQENYTELIEEEKEKLMNEFHRRYPSVYMELSEINKDSPYTVRGVDPYNRNHYDC